MDKPPLKNCTVRTTSGEFRFRGKYLRELETNHWHYYEREDGTLLHFRKEHMIWVIGDTAQSVLEELKHQLHMDSVAMEEGGFMEEAESISQEGKTMDKPPLGIMSQAIHDQKRAIVLLEAMERYVGQDKAIPMEWINELRCLYGSKSEPIRVKDVGL